MNQVFASTGSRRQSPPPPMKRRQPTKYQVIAWSCAAVVAAALAAWILLLSGVANATLAWILPLTIVLPGLIIFYLTYRLVAPQTPPILTAGVLRDALESLPSPRVLIAPSGRVVYANTAFEREFGTDQARPLVALETAFDSDPDAVAQISRVYGSAANGKSARTEIRRKDTSGRPSWTGINAIALNSHPGYVLLRIDDTTAKREMEQVVREAQDKLLDFLENAPVGFYSVDEQGQFLYANQTFANWLGGAPEDIISGGKRLRDYLDDPAKMSDLAYDPFGSGKESEAGEVTLRGLQGRVFQAYISQSVVSKDSGGRLRTRSVVRDLTQERELKRALRESEQQFQRIFEDAPVGIALVDLTGRIVQCNAAFRALAAIDVNDLAGAELVELIGKDERDGVSDLLRRVVAGEKNTVPVEVHPRNHSDLATSLFLNAVTDSDGNVTEVIAHCLDTTEQRNLEVQFAQSQKMQAVGQLAGGMAHDFNNLLTAMIGFCDLLLLRHRPGEQSFADIMQIKQNANRAASLVRQLLAFSRQQTLKPKVLSVTDVLAELGHLLRRLVGESIEVKMVHGRDLGPVRVDQGQLEQVIINLVVNARDAMASKGAGVITIRTSNVENDDPVQLGHEMLPPGEYVLIEVVDQGEGISKANIGRIFEPFFSTKEVGAGTGLGLSTVYGIVKQTDGFIFVESELGKGSTFQIFLPKHIAQEGEVVENAADAEPEDTIPDLTGAGTVLLVEDEDPVRLFSARALRNKGYTVLEAESGEAAMNVVVKKDQPIDLLITDVVMPRMDGPALIREVQKLRPGIKVICISGYAEDAFRKKLDRSADIHFLPKPFSLNQLAGKVKEVMRSTAA